MLKGPSYLPIVPYHVGSLGWFSNGNIDSFVLEGWSAIVGHY